MPTGTSHPHDELQCTPAPHLFYTSADLMARRQKNDWVISFWRSNFQSLSAPRTRYSMHGFIRSPLNFVVSLKKERERDQKPRKFHENLLPCGTRCLWVEREKLKLTATQQPDRSAQTPSRSNAAGNRQDATSRPVLWWFETRLPESGIAWAKTLTRNAMLLQGFHTFSKNIFHAFSTLNL